MSSTAAIPVVDRQYQYLGFITCLYITFQLVCDVTAGKIITVYGMPVSVTVLYFPVTYIFADVLTEVYGYRRARAVLWIVLLSSVTACVLYQIAARWPPAAGWSGDPAYRQVLGVVPRIVLGSWIALFAGEILNNYVMARMKVATGGRHLWLRTTSSTLIGQLGNTALFYGIALSGVLAPSLLVRSIIAGWLAKVAVEVVFTPVTYAVVRALKRAEHEDFFDTETNFNPLILERPF
jgi:queuosine precursor transporter